MNRSPAPLGGLAVRDLAVQYGDPARPTQAVRGVSFDLAPGEVLGIAGESGSGKSSIAFAVLGLLPEGASVSGEVVAGGRDLLAMSRRELRAVRGAEVGMVFQEPMTALNPVLRVGALLASAARAHHRLSRADARDLAERAVVDVGLDPRVLRRYPAELSGGMCQRVVIAMSLVSGARTLIADEPTTALDVTVQARILGLIARLRRDRGMSCLLISHDLSVLAQVCDRILVMYAGEIVETGPAAELLSRPRHPYTSALVQCRIDPRDQGQFKAIPRRLRDQPDGGCRFYGRCGVAEPACAEHPIELTDLGDGQVRCRRSADIGDALMAEVSAALEQAAAVPERAQP
jgi:oligopeptide/dipeptide ABC transporter ATP-binding protein